MARQIAKAYRAGWKPFRDNANFCCWAPREYNVIADHLANVASDSGRNWKDPTVDLEGFDAEEDGILAYSDGGFRDNRARSSSVGIAVFRVRPLQYTINCIFRQYEFWQGGRSSFEAEAVGMECSLNVISDIIHSTTSGHKRQRIVTSG